ncbi:hypothetical protein HJ102_18440 [Vibrio parahaemolyticus]|nr:hypothetical protein [Vibrio parahaemolyticus]MBE4159386.1 hypothetical protein [Vibrio parahaemolyticus]
MKETIVLITNHTPKEITVQGRVMPPLAKDFPLSVFNVNRFKHEVEAAIQTASFRFALSQRFYQQFKNNQTQPPAKKAQRYQHLS